MYLEMFGRCGRTDGTRRAQREGRLHAAVEAVLGKSKAGHLVMGALSV